MTLKGRLFQRFNSVILFLLIVVEMRNMAGARCLFQCRLNLVELLARLGSVGEASRLHRSHALYHLDEIAICKHIVDLWGIMVGMDSK